MIYSRDGNRGFYWFAPVRGPEEWGGMPPPIAFDRDALGDKQAWKAAKAAAKDFYKAVNFQGPRIKVYGSDFLIDGYVTNGDGVYLHPAWSDDSDESHVESIVHHVMSTVENAFEVAQAQGEELAFSLEDIEHDLVRIRVLVTSCGDDEEPDDRMMAAFQVLQSLREQRDAATSEAEIEALEEACAAARKRFDAEMERVIEERDLGGKIEEVMSRISGYFTDDSEQAVGAA
jgi:hypothetical protein